MYYYLTSALKRRVALELKDSFGRHPIYKKIVDYIQNKYSFSERPQFGIVIKGSSANKVALSGDNFIGTIESHVILANVGEPAYPIEWVREDLNAVRENGNIFPLVPGIYYIEILDAPDNPTDPGHFIVDPLLTVTDEAILQFLSGIEQEAQLQMPPAKGTLRLWLNKRQLLKEGADYTVDYTTGALRINVRFSPNDTLTADYRYPAPSVGPVEFWWNVSDHKTLPGVILAFGKRAKAGDKVAIVVYQDRVEAARAFGGKFEVNLDLDVISQDPTQMEEIADLVIMYLWGERKADLETEGIEIVDISMGGEAEEVYDETGDTYFYNASISLQLRSDWEIHIPLPLTFSKVTQETVEGKPGVKAVTTGLFHLTHAIFPSRNNDYEHIK
jgi:hypothetical protein